MSYLDEKCYTVVKMDFAQINIGFSTQTCQIVENTL